MNVAEIELEFEVDDAGNPKFITHGTKQHYLIRAHIEDVPEDAYAVTYVLDPSYPSQFVESRDRSAGFPVSITTYGNYVLKAQIRGTSGTQTTGRSIEKALKSKYYDTHNNAIRDAISYISNN
jgi:hypothetical protein